MGTEKKEKRKYEFHGKEYERKEYVRLVRAEKKEKLRKYREGQFFPENGCFLKFLFSPFIVIKKPSKNMVLRLQELRISILIMRRYGSKILTDRSKFNLSMVLSKE